MEIRRDMYLNKLIRKKKNGMIKVITGVRGCGKSYLLFRLFHDHLAESGIPDDHIIEIALDDRRHKILRDPYIILQFIKEKITDKDDYYILIDDVQYVDRFEEVLNSLLHIRNADVYVTGSHARKLSEDVITEFRGRGDEIRVYPLSFSEYMSVYQGAEEKALDDYLAYGGLPLVAMKEEREDKEKTLAFLFQKYLSDTAERNNVHNGEELKDLMDVLASVAGSYTNASSLVRAFRSMKNKGIGDKKIKKYTDCLTDAFLISRAERYDVKGNRFIANLSKYYFEDTGLIHARTGFSKITEMHLMENSIYNELRVRGYHADAGMVMCYERAGGKKDKKRLDVDFVATRGSEKYYIQFASWFPDADKANPKYRSFLSIPDNFPKIIVVRNSINVRRDNKGIITIGLKDFLLDKNSLRL